MAENSPITFVRARPRKISITETYYYKVEVQDFINFRFDKADGEIKLEFLYDGAVQDFRWKLRQFLYTLLDRVKLFKQIKDIIYYFLHVRVIRWLMKWSGLALLWRTFLWIALGNAQEERYFGVDTIADVAKGGSGCRTARAGHLILYDEQQLNLTNTEPSYQTFVVKLPIDNLQQKLEQNHKCVLTYTYELPQPTSPPIYLHKIELTDAEANRYAPLHSIYDELLNLKIHFEINGSAPLVDTKGQVSSETVKLWWQEVQLKIAKNEKDDQVEEVEEIPISDQIWYIKALDNIDNRLHKLAVVRGGYILIDENYIKTDDGKAIDDKLQRLEEGLLQAAFQRNKLFVPVFRPYSCSIDDQKVFVIPVPAVPPRWYENRPQMRSNKMINRLWVRSEVPKAPDITISIEGEVTSAVKVVAEVIASFANAKGGCFSIKLVGNRKQNTYDLIVNLINRARWYCVPPLLWDLIDFSYYQADEQIATVTIAQSSNEVHSVDGIIHRWEEHQINRLTPDKDTNKVYDLIRERCRPSYPVVEPLPIIKYAHLKGPQFDARKQNGAYYDPRQKALKWTEELSFFYNIDEHVYQNVLQVGLNRPVELYEQNELSGEVHILLPQKVLSGLKLTCFDALGVAMSGEKLKVEKQSNIKIVFDHIVLLDVFRRRGFSASRELHFEGVKLEQNRLLDIQGMLADLGLENITRNTNKRPNIYSHENIPVDEALKNYDGYYITGERPDGLWVKLEIRGELTNLHRERKEGERTERMRIKSGSMHINIQGFVSGDLQQAQELSTLLNHLQRLLKERFNYVRVQVA